MNGKRFWKRAGSLPTAMLLLIVVLALILTTSIAFASPAAEATIVTRLSGAEEVPPRETDAHGIVLLKPSKDGMSLDYRLIVAQIENVTAAHIHCGPAGANGPVGVTLFSGGMAGSGRFDGVLSAGTATSPDAGNSCGWETIQDVLDAMATGNTYVNVHTNDGVVPTNTGPGDFPGGEIRGQIQ